MVCPIGVMAVTPVRAVPIKATPVSLKALNMGTLGVLDTTIAPTQAMRSIRDSTTGTARSLDPSCGWRGPTATRT